MNIVYASDNNYADVMGVSIVSLFENNKDSSEINLYIIDDNISESNKDKLICIAKKYSRKITFIPVLDIVKTAGVEIDVQTWSLSAFSRLFLESMMPEDIDKVLYLDCDIMVNSSIENLYNIDLEDKYCAACETNIRIWYMKIIGLSPNDKWFNSGVMLISLKKWRNEHISSRFVNFIKNQSGKIPFVDEGVINGVINHEIMELPIEYNVKPGSLYFRSSKSYSNYNKHFFSKSYLDNNEDFEKARSYPRLIHFTSAYFYMRPWIKPYLFCRNHPYAKEWLKYKSSSPWSDEPFKSNKGLFKKQLLSTPKIYLSKLLNLFLNILPTRLANKAINHICNKEAKSFLNKK